MVHIGRFDLLVVLYRTEELVGKLIRGGIKIVNVVDFSLLEKVDTVSILEVLVVEKKVTFQFSLECSNRLGYEGMAVHVRH